MSLLRKKATVTTARRRSRREVVAPKKSNFGYRKKRVETTPNTGRNIQRDQTSSRGSKLGNYWLQRFGLLVFLVAVTASIVNVSTLSTDVTVVTPSDAATKSLLRDQTVYAAAAHKLLSESPASRTKLTIDTASLSARLKQQFPEVASASIVLPLAAHHPVLYLEPAEPAIILMARNGSYVLDTGGTVLLESSQLPAGSHLTLPVITDQSNLAAKVGSQALSSRSVQNIRTIIGQLAAKNVTLSALSLPPSANELDAAVSDTSYQVKFNLQTDNARQQAGAFLATQAQLKRTNTTPAKYIDVRVEGRAYYQ